MAHHAVFSFNNNFHSDDSPFFFSAKLKMISCVLLYDINVAKMLTHILINTNNVKNTQPMWKRVCSNLCMMSFILPLLYSYLIKCQPGQARVLAGDEVTAPLRKLRFFLSPSLIKLMLIPIYSMCTVVLQCQIVINRGEFRR